MRPGSWLVLLFVLAQLEPSIPFDGKEEIFPIHCRGNKAFRLVAPPPDSMRLP